MRRAIAVLAAVVLTILSQSSGAGREPLHATVRNLKVTKRLAGPGDRAQFLVEFEAGVRNDRSMEIRLPSSESVCASGAELRSDRGEWITNIQALCIQAAGDETETKNDLCSVVPPGGTHAISNVHANFVARRNTDGHLPATVTARFFLFTYCRDGRVTRLEGVATEPVQIDLPADPER